MHNYDLKYQDVLKSILEKGVDVEDRTGVGVRKIFDVNISQNIYLESPDTFAMPLLSLRKVFPRTAWKELFWMLSGSTNAAVLQNDDIHIWDGNSSREFLDNQGLTHIKEGYIGRGYGHQFRNFNGIDQLKNMVQSLFHNPTSRRHFISLWNPADLNETALPPCHVSYHFVPIGDELNLKFYQRSSDFILAGNTNFVFATFFLIFMAKLTGYKVGTVSQSIGDCHVYHNHLDVAQELIEREIKEDSESWIQWDFQFRRDDMFENFDKIVNFCYQDHEWNYVKIHDYNPHPKIDKDRLIMAI